MGNTSLNLVNKTSTKKRWKREQEIKEEYRSLSWACRDGNRQAQPHLELDLLRGMRGSKGISTATSSAGGLLLNGGTVMKDTGKTKGLSTSFFSAFPGQGLPGLCITAQHLESSSTHGRPVLMRCSRGEEPRLSCSWAQCISKCSGG